MQKIEPFDPPRVLLYEYGGLCFVECLVETFETQVYAVRMLKLMLSECSNGLMTLVMPFRYGVFR